MEFLKKLYYNVGVSEVQSTSEGESKLYRFYKKCKICKKTIDNFPYLKYNFLVMQLGISKEFQKEKGECINYEKAD